MIEYLNTLKQSIVDRFTTDTSELIAQLYKLEAKIEKAIAKDMRKGEQMVKAAQALNDALVRNDRNLNVAYKLLNNVNKAVN